MPQSSQQAHSCTQHFQANSRGLHSLCTAAGKERRACRSLQMAAKENLMGKSFTQTSGWLQSLAKGWSSEEDLSTVQNQQVQDSCILNLQPYQLLHGLQTVPLASYLCKSGKVEITIFRTCILHSLPASLQAVSCLKETSQKVMILTLSTAL